MDTVTADIWMRPDVAKTVHIMRCRSGESPNAFLIPYAFLIGMIEGVHMDSYWTPKEKCERTVAILAAGNAVRAEREEARW